MKCEKCSHIKYRPPRVDDFDQWDCCGLNCWVDAPLDEGEEDGSMNCLDFKEVKNEM